MGVVTKDFLMVLYIAEKARLYQIFCGTTVGIAKDLGLSQQSVSRKLIQLEKDGYVRRNPTLSGVDLALTEKAQTLLQEKCDVLQKLFSHRVVLKGIVQDGLGEGKYYMSIANYKRQFREKMGFTPYEGTLNLKVDEHAVQHFVHARKGEEVLIQGFKTAERTFGDVKAYPVHVCTDVKTVLIVPVRTHHDPNVVELVSDVYLRTKLHLKTGDTVVIE